MLFENKGVMGLNNKSANEFLVIQLFFKCFSPPETNRQPSPKSDILILTMTITDAFLIFF